MSLKPQPCIHDKASAYLRWGWAIRPGPEFPGLLEGFLRCDTCGLELGSVALPLETAAK